jgi:hypothetical protein
MIPSAARLFPGYGAGDLDTTRVGPFVLSRLLEDGDFADLRALFQSVPESAAAGWLAAHGGRQLSRRSCAFWRVVFGTEPGPTAPGAADLWPQ